MGAWLDRSATAWLDATLAVVLLTGATALAMIQCRQPVRRRVWGRLGLVASLLVIPLVALNPLPKVDLRHPTARLWLADPGRRSPGEAPELRPDRSLAPDWVWVGEAPSVDSWFRLIMPGLLVAYGCGLAFTLGRLGVGLIGTQLLVRQSTPASRDAVEVLAKLPFVRREADRPRVRVCQRLQRPVLVGAWRPLILIPPDLDRPEARVPLRLGLLHELAHAEIDDHRFAWLANLAHAVWFFLPQVWWVRSQLRLDAEFLADHRAVGHFGTSHGYAASLVGLAMVAGQAPAVGRREPTRQPDPRSGGRGPTELDPRPQPASAGLGPIRVGGLASALFQRVQMLLKCPFAVEDHAPRRWIYLVAVVVLGWSLIASCVTLHPESVGEDRAPAVTLDMAELAIAPQLLNDRLFDLRFRLPGRFQLTCEVLATPEELGELEILGYRLDTRADGVGPASAPPSWHHVAIERAGAGSDAIQVDGRPLALSLVPDPPATTLTIRPIPHKMTRFRDLHLSW